MNADERNNQQQGYGQQDSEQASQQNNTAQGQQQQQQPIAQGQESSGQASYGNSGESAIETLSQNSSDLGQEADLGQSDDRKLFSGADDDVGGSASSDGQDNESDPSGIRSDGQSLSGQGPDAMSEDTIGSDGTTDIEVERSQGRESDIEGSSL